MRLNTIADDSASKISRNRVSFNLCDSKGRDQGELARLSTIISKKLPNTTSSKVLTLKLIEELSSHNQLHTKISETLIL
jgi:hypothetical protein